MLPNVKVLVQEVLIAVQRSHERGTLRSGDWHFDCHWQPRTAHSSHTATLLPTGKVLVAGGYNNEGDVASAELYDPATGTWTETGSLTTARDSHTATLLPNGKVLVAAGFGNSGWLSSAEVYDPASGTWTATGSLATARYSHTAIAAQRQVLVAGGWGTSGTVSIAQLRSGARH